MSDKTTTAGTKLVVNIPGELMPALDKLLADERAAGYAKAEKDIAAWLHEYATPIEVDGNTLVASTIAQGIADILERGEHRKQDT